MARSKLLVRLRFLDDFVDHGLFGFGLSFVLSCGRSLQLVLFASALWPLAFFLALASLAILVDTIPNSLAHAGSYALLPWNALAVWYFCV